MIKRRQLRLYTFRVDSPQGTAAGFCQTYFMDAAESRAAAEFFLVRSTFPNRAVFDPDSNPSTFQLELRVVNQAHVELPDREVEATWIADQLREAFGDARVVVAEIDFG